MKLLKDNLLKRKADEDAAEGYEEGEEEDEESEDEEGEEDEDAKVCAALVSAHRTIAHKKARAGPPPMCG